MSHDTLVTSAPEAGFAYLEEALRAFAATDARVRRNAALARALSPKSECSCEPARKPAFEARLVFPLVRIGGLQSVSFVPFPLVYAAYRMDSRFVPFVEVFEASAPGAFCASARPRTLAEIDTLLSRVGEPFVVPGLLFPSGAVPSERDGVTVDRVRRAVLRMLWAACGSMHDVRFSHEEGNGVPACAFGSPSRERFLPNHREGASAWTLWIARELSAGDVAQLQN